MKKLFAIHTASLLLLAAANSGAQTTNPVSTNTGAIPTNGLALTNAAPKKDYGKYDLTLGGDGSSSVRTGKSAVQFDVSLTTDPFKHLTNLWVGIDQGLAWEPSFGGSTDFTAWWPFDVYKGTIYINPGWSAGMVYSTAAPSFFRTGPLVELQYYVFDDAFFYGDVNYDAVMSRGEHGLRYSIGIGIEF